MLAPSSPKRTLTPAATQKSNHPAGGVLVAAVAWMRVTAVVYYGGPATEPSGPLWWRRVFVVLGGFLLSAGFALQMWATYRQIE